ncbi:hypothetical protein SAMN05877753_101129 [Bacillus oleivorans]|uniref:Uncharacterized protein n=1 Tax=Bacillus oleivorans TaxID=1448271 RepID=A0A285CGU1_9BACI|nr:hypothetical protein [Bacillus oleivorans]SNX66817.1 hypothetical protein SAMN05877753_101129 [Bacillus oleivorans]
MHYGPWCYGSLFGIAIILLIISCKKAKTKRVFLLFFAVTGSLLFFDYLIYVWGEAYQYYPNIIRGKYDSKLGSYINAVIIASTATLYSVFQAGRLWSLGLAILYTMIEILFLRIGVYQHHWWKFWYTLILLFVFFPVIKGWWNRINYAHRSILSLLTLICCFYAIRIILAFFQYGLLEVRTFHVESIVRIGKESIALNSLILLPVSIFLSCLIFFRINKTWLLIGIVLSSIIDLGFKSLGMISARVPWDWMYYLAADCVSVLAVIYFAKMLKQEERLPFNR